MPPQTLTPNQPIAPAPVNTDQLGVASPVASPAAVPTQLPTLQAPAAAATPASVGSPSTAAPGIMDAIANYYQIPGQTARTVAAGQGQANVAQSQFEKQKAENTINIKNQQDALNPSSYTITKDPTTGGINILNSLGDKVDLATYANLTGSNPATTLQQHGSTAPADQKFVAAYNNFQTYAQAMIAAQNGDKQAQISVGDFQKNNLGLANLDLGQLSNAFMAQYGQYFGAPTNNSNSNAMGGLNGVGSTLTSQNNPVNSSAYQEMNYYPSLAAANPVSQSLLSGTGTIGGVPQGSNTATPTTTSTSNNSNNALLAALQQQITPGG